MCGINFYLKEIIVTTGTVLDGSTRLKILALSKLNMAQMKPSSISLLADTLASAQSMRTKRLPMTCKQCDLESHQLKTCQ
jgi:hypothetical protein